jgi:hypothetical protein
LRHKPLLQRLQLIVFGGRCDRSRRDVFVEVVNRFRDVFADRARRTDFHHQFAEHADREG